jgi:hypothetical protein
MRNRSKLGLLVAGVVLVLAAGGPAIADPPSGSVPAAADVVGVGAGPTTALFDQFSRDYNGQHPGGPHLYSWDAADPATGSLGGKIVTKTGCAAVPRPGDSSAGVAMLQKNRTVPASAPGTFCVDYARSYRARQPSDPPLTSGGVAFVDLASDAVTYTRRAAASGGSDAPASLTSQQLKAIYLCQVTSWAAVGGPAAPVHPFLPQPGSEIRSFFLTALGGGPAPITPGPCVSDLGGTLAEDQGLSPALDDPDAIVPYSVADYLAQAYHSAACLSSGCTGTPACLPSGSQNLFGCDQHGVLGLGEISGTAPVKPWPLPAGPCPQCQLNLGFSALFQHFLYTVVRYDTATTDHIPPVLEKLFGSSGWTCTNPAAGTDLQNYGFRRDCGTPH